MKQVKLRYSKYGHNLYFTLYGESSPKRIESETALLKYRAEQLFGEYDKSFYEEAIADDFEK